MAMKTVHRLLQTPIPATLSLTRRSFEYDTGIAPASIKRSRSGRQSISDIFPAKRERFAFNSNEIDTLTLRETDRGNRLTIDEGATRHDLASSASEIEREWLHDYIKQIIRY